jgi:hypothetical protein
MNNYNKYQKYLLKINNFFGGENKLKGQHNLPKIQIDLTIIKTSYNPNELHMAPKSYELEIDFMGKPSEKNFELLIKEVQILKQVLNGSSVIIKKDETTSVLVASKKLTFSILDFGLLKD